MLPFIERSQPRINVVQGNRIAVIYNSVLCGILGTFRSCLKKQYGGLVTEQPYVSMDMSSFSIPNIPEFSISFYRNEGDTRGKPKTRESITGAAPKWTDRREFRQLASL
jgi:hypothetical protein